MLVDAGIAAIIADDRVPQVPVGAYEVRVPPGDASRAEELLDAVPDAGDGDASEAMDLETVLTFDTNDAEMEAMAVKGLLEASGIPAVVVGSSSLPSLPFEVRVPRETLETARASIAEARAAGPAAAEAAVAETSPGVAEELDEEDEETVDTSPDFDLETVASFETEMEALSLKALLDSAGIAAMVTGVSALPSLPFEVRVPRSEREAALKRISEAEAAGPAGAEEAERETEV
jgi:hypothetical protein